MIEELGKLALYSGAIIVGWFVFHILYWRNKL